MQKQFFKLYETFYICDVSLLQLCNSTFQHKKPQLRYIDDAIANIISKSHICNRINIYS